MIDSRTAASPLHEPSLTSSTVPPGACVTYKRAFQTGLRRGRPYPAPLDRLLELGAILIDDTGGRDRRRLLFFRGQTTLQFRLARLLLGGVLAALGFFCGLATLRFGRLAAFRLCLRSLARGFLGGELLLPCALGLGLLGPSRLERRLLARRFRSALALGLRLGCALTVRGIVGRRRGGRRRDGLYGLGLGRGCDRCGGRRTRPRQVLG